MPPPSLISWVNVIKLINSILIPKLNFLLLFSPSSLTRKIDLDLWHKIADILSLPKNLLDKYKILPINSGGLNLTSIKVNSAVLSINYIQKSLVGLGALPSEFFKDKLSSLPISELFLDFITTTGLTIDKSYESWLNPSKIISAPFKQEISKVTNIDFLTKNLPPPWEWVNSGMGINLSTFECKTNY